MKNEYRYSLYSPGKFFPSQLEFVADDLLANKSGFGSLYQIDSLTAQALAQAESAKDFKGVVWSERLWMDFDNGEAADLAEAKLRQMGLDYVAYFSGRAGAHFGVLRYHEPSHLLPGKDKAWVSEHFPKADTSIYTHLHLFRLPGTLHEMTRLRKELISDVKSDRFITLPKLEKKHDNISNSPMLASSSGSSIFDCYRFMAQIKKARNGNRHATLVAACYALRDDVKLSLNEARFLVQELNKNFPEPKDEIEVDKIIRSIF